MQKRLKILVRAPNWMGDHVMATDFYKALRREFADAHITLVVPAEFAILGAVGFDDVIVLSKTQRKLLGGLDFWSRDLRRAHFDIAILLTASWSSAILARAARIPVRVGYAEQASGVLLTQSRAWRGRADGKHKAQLYRELMELLNKPVAPVHIPAPRRQGAFKDIVIAPGASITLREWPYFIELAKALRGRYPEATIRFVGTAAQKTWGEKAALRQDEKIENWVGRTDLNQLTELCSDARLVVANDSGVAHLAARTGVPTVVLFGPGDPAYVTPLGPDVRVVRVPDLPCSPCEKPYCRAPFGYQACLKTLSPEQVLSSLPGSR